MKKGVIWGLISALTIVTSAVGTNIYLSAKQENEVKYVISASREECSLDESVEQADAVAELPEEIRVLQDGTKKMPMSDNPIFQKGEKYILVMKQAKSLEDNRDAYWILKEYFVSGNQAIGTLPTGELTAEAEEVRTYDSAENWNREMMRKESELAYDSEIINKSDLVEVIEEVE